MDDLRMRWRRVRWYAQTVGKYWVFMVSGIGGALLFGVSLLFLNEQKVILFLSLLLIIIALVTGMYHAYAQVITDLEKYTRIPILRIGLLDGKSYDYRLSPSIIAERVRVERQATFSVRNALERFPTPETGNDWTTVRDAILEEQAAQSATLEEQLNNARTTIPDAQLDFFLTVENTGDLNTNVNSVGIRFTPLPQLFARRIGLFVIENDELVHKENFDSLLPTRRLLLVLRYAITRADQVSEDDFADAMGGLLASDVLMQGEIVVSATPATGQTFRFAAPLTVSARPLALQYRTYWDHTAPRLRQIADTKADRVDVVVLPVDRETR